MSELEEMNEETFVSQSGGGRRTRRTRRRGRGGRRRSCPKGCRRKSSVCVKYRRPKHHRSTRKGMRRRTARRAYRR